ncbi:MAG: hypothetical protein A2498_00525 [Lentisphaerae bacterium RIFOXYC12_FULL_60_16]|nr:MAG: hypothetical protein A2498_00525 [Lentisphaerae bacterium RIFOXYC12_FULL_60_16]OGV72007.1 MAG: hypothetical protein A2269_06995 [Lentisphaerae bacterium RIFOXYA12_FULL_60_10]OGV83879.1 MAG: hypothetical protein A2340_12165 [Lentisphaerae bacterium RIFOXYB12_FULL_60_10]
MPTISRKSIAVAVRKYRRAVEGVQVGSYHPDAVLQFALEHGSPTTQQLAQYFESTGNPSAFEALVAAMQNDGRLVTDKE